MSHHFHPESWATVREGGGQALTGARAGRAIERRKDLRPGCRGLPLGRRQHPSHRYGEGGRNPAVSKNPGTHVRAAPGPGRSPCHPAVVAGSLRKGGVRTEDGRHGEVRLGRSSCEVGEQGDVCPCGADGAKGRARGESGKPKRAPDAVPGERVTGGRPDTAIRGTGTTGASDGASPPCHGRSVAAGVLRAEEGCRGRRGRRDLADVRGRAGRAGWPTCTTECTRERTGRRHHGG